MQNRQIRTKSVKDVMTAMLTAVLAVAVTSCDLRPLYIEGETPVEVLVLTDWTQLGGDPTGSTICFYPEDQGKTPLTFKTNSVTRTVVNVPSGYYTVQVFNRTVDEFGTMRFTGMESLSTVRAILEEKLFSWVGRADTVGRTVYEPEEIVVGRADHFYVRTIGERTTSLRTKADSGSGMEIDSVQVTPQRVRYAGTVSVRIHGIHNIRSMRAYLTGMAGEAYLATRSAGETLATHVLESWRLDRDTGDYTKGWVRGEFHCFGLPDQYKGDRRAENNRLVLEFRLVDNKTVIRRIVEAGAMVDQNEAERTDNIVVETAIVLPDVKPEEGSESGFDVTFTDWDDPIDIPVGI